MWNKGGESLNCKVDPKWVQPWILTDLEKWISGYFADVRA